MILKYNKNSLSFRFYMLLKFSFEREHYAITEQKYLTNFVYKSYSRQYAYICGQIYEQMANYTLPTFHHCCEYSH